MLMTFGSVSNLGGTFPRFFVLKLVDMFTTATCQPPRVAPLASQLKNGASVITSSFSCALESEKHRCVEGGGVCKIVSDGYYSVNILCIIIGAVTFVMYIRPKALQLQSLPLKAWRRSEA